MMSWLKRESQYKNYFYNHTKQGLCLQCSRTTTIKSANKLPHERVNFHLTGRNKNYPW